MPPCRMLEIIRSECHLLEHLSENLKVAAIYCTEVSKVMDYLLSYCLLNKTKGNLVLANDLVSLASIVGSL